MIYGYARVSTKEQNLYLQICDLKRYGVDTIIQDKISSRKSHRLDGLLEKLKSGDTLVIKKLDRLGTNARQLSDLVDYFSKSNINFVSLKDSIDTRTPMGKFTFVLFAALAELERDLISMRTIAGLAAARDCGRIGGRPPKNHKDIELALNLYKAGFTAHKIQDLTGLSTFTLYRYIQQEVIALYKSGMSIDDIAHTTKYNRNAIIRTIRKYT